jgi:glutamyl-tRNA synthetase
MNMIRRDNHSSVRVRFAPSPTGLLHIGGARTALFNYLYAKHTQGKFLLRIEDTDKTRSTKEAIDAIIEGLKWLEIDWDEEIVMQSSREERHREVALELLNQGKAYYCYISPEELEQARSAQTEKNFHFTSKWRDADPSLIPPTGVKPVIRIKAPKEGIMIIDDVIQGKVEVDYSEIDDFVLLRSDGTPTYMLAVVVDDVDMGITHIIRGDDHLTNAARQNVIYQAMNWDIPSYTHIPLIHGEDGAKLSKRHGALGVHHYREMGYLKESICNYLLRLGWGHGNEEIISRNQAIEWFDIHNIGKSPSRFDFKKLDNLNAYYMKNKDNALLLPDLQPFLESLVKRSLNKEELNLVEKGLDGLKQRAKTLKELAEKSLFYIVDAFELFTEDTTLYFIEENKKLFQRFIDELQQAVEWNKTYLMELAKKIAVEEEVQVSHLMQIPRIALTGSIISPSVPEILENFGKEKSLARLNKLLQYKFS